MDSHHDLTSITESDKSNLELKVSDNIFLDFLLEMKISSTSIAYAVMKKKKIRKKNIFQTIFRKSKESNARLKRA